MKKLLSLIILLSYLAILPAESSSDNIPQAVKDYSIEHSITKKAEQNIKLYYVQDWEDYAVYIRINNNIKTIDGNIPVVGLPMYILHNEKETRFASGCERDEIMSNGKVKCQQPFDYRIKIYSHENK